MPIEASSNRSFLGLKAGSESNGGFMLPLSSDFLDRRAHTGNDSIFLCHCHFELPIGLEKVPVCVRRRPADV